MARSTMAWLITEVRLLIGDTDSVDRTDDQIQAVLDSHRIHRDREKLTYDREQKIYTSSHNMFEGVVDADAGSWSGDTTIALWAGYSEGATEVTPDAWNLREGDFSFTASQDQRLYLDAWEYDVHLVASYILKQFAASKTIPGGWGASGGIIRARHDLIVLAQIQSGLAKGRKGKIVRHYS